MDKKAMSQRKIDGYLKLAEIINWGRMYPIRFVERFLGLDLLDYQKYVLLKSWYTPYCVWCMGRSSGKTTLGSPFLMTKSLLIPNFQAYILAGSGSQSQEMFMKIEKIAKREIASFTGLTDVFMNETVKSTANTDGFTHNPSSFEYNLYNGSAVNSLNGAINNIRSKRSNCNFYDESGFAPDELFTASEPFCTQNSDFRLGGDVDVTLFPKQFPNQLIYASSASSIDTYFFKKYSEFSKKMFLGDNRYFVADINSDVVINATYNGKLYPVPLLTQEVIDTKMRENKEKAMREYKNIFTTEGGNDQIVKRANIIRNSELRVPILYNDGNKKFGIGFDPARSYDQSVCVVGEFYWDDIVGYKMKLVNSVSFVDIAKKKKTPMRTPEQIELVKQMILDYNGKNAADYENIEALEIDAGAGGGGVNIADYFMEDWVDKKGNKHKGMIDKVESVDYISKFPNAVDKIKLLSPQKYKKMLFEALIEMMNLDLISFPETYDGKGYLTMDDTDGDEIKSKVYKLSFEEEMALIQLDLAKEELVNIYRFKSSNGNCRYDLASDKVSKMNDDRAYAIAMLAWYLQQLRRKHITGKSNKDVDWLSYCLY
ncbi:MAG: terminase [Tissierellia bacterium]|nr:terminase [Tissierellia bacterium]